MSFDSVRRATGFISMLYCISTLLSILKPFFSRSTPNAPDMIWLDQEAKDGM